MFLDSQQRLTHENSPLDGTKSLRIVVSWFPSLYPPLRLELQGYSLWLSGACTFLLGVRKLNRGNWKFSLNLILSIGYSWKDQKYIQVYPSIQTGRERQIIMQ